MFLNFILSVYYTYAGTFTVRELEHVSKKKRNFQYKFYVLQQYRPINYDASA